VHHKGDRHLRPLRARGTVGDWLYPTYQSQEIRNAILQNGLAVACLELSTIHGHDAFLIENEKPPEGGKPGVKNKMIQVVRDFLGNVASRP